MTIAHHENRNQVTCDTCPASYPNTYAADDWSAMIADAKVAGWSIRKTMPAALDRDTSDLFGAAPRMAGSDKPQTHIHTCPDCAKAQQKGPLL
ncbi:hypothetical protein GA830_12030 [Mesorhizobium sp. NBSH29]|uniref:hypothetical protein n=1 Tax=Mesorhizobium sp. NBSH29 TaxID=2654249 RepID=UPI0018967FFE|nr:hypothetical protein [Mesorhizobium sp. NBSH29]QPC87386.1 hypothetical protein GA830_12030 [Mesorhizobium sp. NBSH29]